MIMQNFLKTHNNFYMQAYVMTETWFTSFWTSGVENLFPKIDLG